VATGHFEDLVAIGLDRLAAQAVQRGDEARARRLLDESLAFNRRTGFRKGEVTNLAWLGHLERRGGAPERALELYEQSLALARGTGFTWWEKNMLLSEALVLCELGRALDARRRAAEALGWPAGSVTAAGRSTRWRCSHARLPSRATRS